MFPSSWTCRWQPGSSANAPSTYATEAAKLKEQAAAYWAIRSRAEKAERALAQTRSQQGKISEALLLNQRISALTQELAMTKKVLMSNPQLKAAFEAQLMILQRKGIELERGDRLGQ